METCILRCRHSQCFYTFLPCIHREETDHDSSEYQCGKLVGELFLNDNNNDINRLVRLVQFNYVLLLIGVYSKLNRRQLVERIG